MDRCSDSGKRDEEDVCHRQGTLVAAADGKLQGWWLPTRDENYYY